MDEHLEELAKARLGSVLKDKWTLDELLGVGGMAAVYAATHRNKNRVAIKMLHSELSHNPEMKRRFLREGYVANSVEHEGALAVRDDDEAEDGSVFLVMDLIEGEDLDERRKRFDGSLPQREALALMDQLLDVLVAAHERGVLHRDLKPENLLVDDKGKITVLDFGIARLREMSSSTTHTKTGVLLGTPAFMAPEQAASLWDDVDERSDIWAVGATLYTLLCGRMVHEAETLTQVLALAVTRQADSIAMAKPDLHPSVVELVDKALAFDKVDRFQSAAEMQTALRAARDAVLDSPDSVAGPPQEPTTARPRAKPRKVDGDKHPAQTTVAAVTAQQLEQQSKRASRGVIVAVVGVLTGAVIGVAMMSGEGDETDSAASAAPAVSETAPPTRGKPWRAPARPSASSFEPLFGDAGAGAPSASASAAVSASVSASPTAAANASPSALQTAAPKTGPSAAPATSASPAPPVPPP